MTNSFVEDTWEDAYDVVNVANNVLSALDVFEDDADARDRAEGQARFLRGLLYFELVRLWGPAWTGGSPGSDLGVPLVLEPTRAITEADDRARSTVGEVYAQVITDLQAARDLLPESDGDLADTYAASAVLSRVYLSQGDYANAAAEADRVIEAGGHALAPTYAAAFGQSAGSPEYVFAVPITEQDGVNELNTFYGARENSGRGDIQLTDDYVGLFLGRRRPRVLLRRRPGPAPDGQVAGDDGGGRRHPGHPPGRDVPDAGRGDPPAGRRR